MARRAQPIGRVELFGGLALAFVLALTAGTLATVAWNGEWSGGLRPGDWAAIRFTLWQAVLSAAISVVLAVPLARALARRAFPGRRTIIALLGAPFILPVIVAILGIVAVFGRSGVVNQGLALIGVDPVSIYGAHGVVFAHVFFNLPLATRLILQGWLSIPAERFQLAATLGFRTGDLRRVLEWPMLRDVLPGAFLVILLLCLNSFAVALALGGGPRATTVELAIYEAFRLDFDLGRAALLASVQFALGAAAALVAMRVALPGEMGAGLDRAVRRWDADEPGQKLMDGAVIVLGSMFLILPLAAVVANGLPGLLSLPGPVVSAAIRSLGVALSAAGLTLILALPIAALTVRRSWHLAEWTGMLTIAASPMVVGTGLFLLVYPLTDPSAIALAVTAVVNAAMALPFALRVLVPALREAETAFGHLADTLGMTGMARLRLLWVPRLRRSLGFAAGLAGALAMGDLGVIALFAGAENATLPLQLYRLMGAYRMEAAASAGLVLLALALGIFWLFDRGGRIDADA